MSAQIHFEVFSRKTPQASWVLQLATEDKETALHTADTLINSLHAAAVRVSREVFNAGTGEFHSYQVMQKGTIAPAGKPARRPVTEPVCTTPQTLYTLPARETIGRLMEDWLRRWRVTPFELLHSPVLAEKLEASGHELQHAIQKLSIPEAQETGQPVHEIIRRWTGLIERAVGRVIEDGRKRRFPEITPETVVAVVQKISGQSDRDYLLGGAVTVWLETAKGAAARLEALLALAGPLIKAGSSCDWAVRVVEIPVCEILAQKGAVADISGTGAEPGMALAALTRLLAGSEISKAAAYDPQIARVLPPVSGALQAYAVWLEVGHFSDVKRQSIRHIISELRGPRRLRPSDAVSEIELLRAMAVVLTMTGGDEAQREDLTSAFVERSRMLVSSTFIDALLQGADDGAEELERLVWLCENVVGISNKREAARWMLTALTGVKFERVMRESHRPVGQKLRQLAGLQQRISGAGLNEKDSQEAHERLGQMGAVMAQEAQVIKQIARTPQPMQRVAALLGFATGQAAPAGPLSDQARAEVMRQLKDPDVRAELSKDGTGLMALKPLLQKIGIGG
ncbi:hypothetical protein [Asticcacaulis tiandongensis]|uniref:hypothetical protein n=1 Tax=Asticcacaulis tiandongensis TaxID=2565365 RepID=UPI00112B981A|nr:hypothetical protein [Asticcacaulis tiandongensis]